MTPIETIQAAKEKIIRQLYADLEATPESERFFNAGNIRDCEKDLDHYIHLLSKAHESKNLQKEISKHIKWIFQSLATFKSEDESPEFLWGFIYNGYTKELTDFILQAAFTFGLEKGKLKTIKSNVFHLTHHPHSFDTFSIYIGSTSNSGVVLLLNRRTGCFEYNENPHGDSYGLPVFHLQSHDDFSTLSFEVLTAGAYKTFLLKAQRPVDRVLFKAILQLHQSEVFKPQPEPDYCKIELELNKGVLTNLSTLHYDSDNHIINMFTEGTGIKAFVKELDATGAFQNSDNAAPHPAIVSEKFVLVYAVPKWKYYEIDSLAIHDNIVTVTTKTQQFEYEAEGVFNVVSSDISSKTVVYELKSYPFMIRLLNVLLSLREVFRSRFE